MNISFSMTVTVMFKSPSLTSLMQAADVFDKSKVATEGLKMLLLRGEMPDSLSSEAAISRIMEGASKIAAEENCIYLFVHSFQMKGEDYENITVPPYVAPGIQTISNGEKFSIFADVIKANIPPEHFIVEEDKFRIVTGVIPKP